MKTLWIIIILVVLAGAGGGFYYYNSKPKEEPLGETVAVTSGPITQSVSANGKVVSNLDVDIKCKASGEIIRLPFDIGDVVKRGDLLVELDPTDEERSVKQATVGLESSQAQLKSARENLAVKKLEIEVAKKKADAALETSRIRIEDLKAKAARAKELFAKGLISREELETTLSNLDVTVADRESLTLALADIDSRTKALVLTEEDIKIAEAGVRNDQIALDIARQRLSNTRVSAPMDGVVTAKSVQKGQIVSSPISNVGGGTTILTLSDLNHIFVLASVDEADIGAVKLGLPVELRVDAFAGEKFAGQVVRISPRGANVSNVVTFEVKIEVISPNKSLLMPEMTATSNIIIDRKEKALLVPAEGVVRKGRKEFATVLLDGNKKEERAIETGITDGQRYEIKSGLAEGEKVLLEKGKKEQKWQAGGGRMPPGMMR